MDFRFVAFHWTVVVFFLGVSVFLYACSIYFVKQNNPLFILFIFIFFIINIIVFFFFRGIELLSLLFLIVYIGAVAVLFLFVFMLFNIRNVPSSYWQMFFWRVAGLVQRLLFKASPLFWIFESLGYVWLRFGLIFCFVWILWVGLGPLIHAVKFIWYLLYTWVVYRWVLGYTGDHIPIYFVSFENAPIEMWGRLMLAHYEAYKMATENIKYFEYVGERALKPTLIVELLEYILIVAVSSIFLFFLYPFLIDKFLLLLRNLDRVEAIDIKFVDISFYFYLFIFFVTLFLYFDNLITFHGFLYEDTPIYYFGEPTSFNETANESFIVFLLLFDEYYFFTLIIMFVLFISLFCSVYICMIFR
jgi:NADH-ubiquinone/plastoquinone oxidoreductase chain 6